MKRSIIAGLIIVMVAAALRAATDETLAFTSLRPDGTNLVVEADIPANVSSVILETRSNLNEHWTPIGKLEIAEAPAHVAFTVPRPSQMQFLRLMATTKKSANATTSDLTYVTVPALIAKKTSTHRQPEATFHFVGKVDGSDEIIITRKGAFWKHHEWDWPDKAVSVNGIRWEPQQCSFLTTSNGGDFIPPQFDFENASLEIIQARDVVVLERTNDALIVHIDDTPPGPGDYDFILHFTSAKATAAQTSTSATLKISATIDGSDTVTIDNQKAEWHHGQWDLPTNVKLNGQPWDIASQPLLLNTAETPSVPSNINFRTARLTQKSGRDLVSMWSTETNLTVTFADNPNGAAPYEAEIQFGPIE